MAASSSYRKYSLPRMACSGAIRSLDTSIVTVSPWPTQISAPRLPRMSEGRAPGDLLAGGVERDVRVPDGFQVVRESIGIAPKLSANVEPPARDVGDIHGYVGAVPDTCS